MFTFDTLARVKHGDSTCLSDTVAALGRLLKHPAVVAVLPFDTRTLSMESALAGGAGSALALARSTPPSVCCAFLERQLATLAPNPARAPLVELLLRTSDASTRSAVARLLVACVLAVVKTAGDGDARATSALEPSFAAERRHCHRVWTQWVDAYVALIHEAARRNWVRFAEFFEGLQALAVCPAIAARLRARDTIVLLGDFVTGENVAACAVSMGSTQFPPDFSPVIGCIAELVCSAPLGDPETEGAAQGATQREEVPLSVAERALLGSAAFLRSAIDNPTPAALTSLARIVCRCSRHSRAFCVIFAEELLRALQCATAGNLRAKSTLKDVGGSLSLGAATRRHRFIVPLWAIARAWLAIEGDGLETYRAALFVGPALPAYTDALPGAVRPAAGPAVAAASSPVLAQGSFGVARHCRNESRGGAAATQGSCTPTRSDAGAAASLRSTQLLGVERWLPFLQRLAAARYVPAPSCALAGDVSASRWLPLHFMRILLTI